MKKIFLLSSFLLILACVTMTSCGKSKQSDDSQNAIEVEEQESQLAEALSHGNLKQASAMADSMSLFVDDFTPEQTVQVLTAFVTVHKDAVSKRERRRDLETIRKYVDVYDIALSVNPKDTRAAFEKAKRLDPSLDFDSIATDFRSKLSQYDSLQDGSLISAEPEKPDSTATNAKADSVPQPYDEEIPLELRPAE